MKTIANISRISEIAMVLIKYGFGDLLLRMDLPIKNIGKKISSAVDPDIDINKRIRMALEELGPTFVKIGQMLSMRPELLPAQLIDELSHLQDNVEPVPFEVIKSVLADEFDEPLDSLFINYETEPVASASLSQVHRAVLTKKGVSVAVKVQRPGIAETIEVDLDILAMVTQQAHDTIDALKVYDLPGVVKANRQTLLREINFMREARYIQVARARFGNDGTIYIPAVYSDHSTEKVLVTEFIQGEKISSKLKLSDLHRKNLAKAGVKSAVTQILQHGFYHADPHPGNMLVTDDYRLCLMDWGMVGRLTEGERDELLFLVQAINDRDTRELVNMLLNITTLLSDTINRSLLEKDLMELMDVYLSIPLEEVRVKTMLVDFVEVIRNHQLRLSPDLSMVIKALITVEGTARMLFPEIDVMSEAEPHIRDLVAERHSAGRIRQRLQSNLSSMWTLQQHLPGSLSSIVKQVENGSLAIQFKHKNLESFQKLLESSFNLLTLGIILGAMIIGSSMIITTGVKPWLFGFPALGMIGYLIAAVIGLWLIIIIIRRQNY
ncbi:ABC1 kinase family protein [Desulfocicer niacini]